MLTLGHCCLFWHGNCPIELHKLSAAKSPDLSGDSKQFVIIPNQPLTAEKSVTRCVKCVSCSDQRLQQMSADLHQIAHLAIAENSPKYDPEHESGASFCTFIRSKVCNTLWNESEKLLQWIPCPTVEEVQEPQEFVANPLVDR